MSKEQSVKHKFITSYTMNFAVEDPAAFTQYQALVAPLFDLEAEYDQTFYSASKVYFFNDVTFSSSLANTTKGQLSRTEDKIRRSGLNHITLLLYKHAPLIFVADGLKKEIAAGSMLFLDMAQPSELHISSIYNLSVNLPRSYLENMMVGTDSIHGLEINSGPHYQLLLSYLNTLEEVAGQIMAKDAFSVNQTLLAMIANCFKAMPRRMMKLGGHSRVLIHDVKKLIDKHIMDSALSVDWLAKSFNISRATLYRIFGPAQSVADYIQGRKLEYAYSVLSDVNKRNVTMTQLSESLGYSHPSAFSRAFFDKFGVRPTKVKAQEAGRVADIAPWTVNLDLEAYKQNP